MPVRVLWLLPGAHVVVSAITGYHYARHMFRLAAAASWGREAPEATLAQLLFWLFNMPCLLAVSLLSGIVPLSWQPQEYFRVWAMQPVAMLGCGVVNMGVWFWLAAQWEEPGESITWWRWVLAIVGFVMATGVIFHSRTLDPQVIPFVVWPLLMAGWAMRVRALLV